MAAQVESSLVICNSNTIIINVIITKSLILPQKKVTRGARIRSGETTNWPQLALQAQK